MIFGDDFVLNFSSNVTTLKVTGGTGAYRHVHGTISHKSTGSNGNNGDVTIKISY